MELKDFVKITEDHISIAKKILNENITCGRISCAMCPFSSGNSRIKEGCISNGYRGTKDFYKVDYQLQENVPNIEIDIEIDIDKELDIEIDKKIDKKKSDKIVDYVKTKALTYENNLIEFIEFRKNIKKPLTELGINKIINQLTKWGYNTNQIIEVLDNSIMNNWQGIFQLKENNYKNNSNKIIKNTVYTETKDEYDLALEKILEGK